MRKLLVMIATLMIFQIGAAQANELFAYVEREARATRSQLPKQMNDKTVWIATFAVEATMVYVYRLQNLNRQFSLAQC